MGESGAGTKEREIPMLSKIRKRVSYVNVILIVIAVFALTGGAYAASKYVITSIKQIKPSVLAQLKGAAGKPGTAGSTGPAGPAGSAGPRGQAGADGPNGETGGTGPEGKEGPTGPTGPKGATGPTGSPWTAGGTLPSKSTETGVWTVAGIPFKDPAIPIKEIAVGPISFPIPLSKGLEKEAKVIGFEEGAGEKKENLPEENNEKLCNGNYKKPEAAPGYLCMFVGNAESKNAEFVFPQSIETGGNFSAGRTGALVEVFAEKAGENVYAVGTWAVTAP